MSGPIAGGRSGFADGREREAENSESRRIFELAYRRSTKFRTARGDSQAPFLFFTLLESSEREKNKIKSDFDKVFPVAPVATFDAFFWGEKKGLRRRLVKVDAKKGKREAAARPVEGIATVAGARRPRREGRE